MALKSKNYLPPNGFVYHEALTGWSSPVWLGFDDTVRALIAHRAANRGRFAAEKMDFAQVSVEVEQQVEARLRQTYGDRAKEWITEVGGGSPPPNFPWPPHRAPLGVAVAEGAKKVVSGVGTVLSWLGSGLKPTDQVTANTRAVICVTCPNNVALEGIQKAIGTVGDVLHAIVKAKSELKLQTIHDAKLLQCSACLCHLPAKVWVPAEHIKKGMTPEVHQALAHQCWIRPIVEV